jgi:hypothetical protein
MSLMFNLQATSRNSDRACKNYQASKVGFALCRINHDQSFDEFMM